MKGGPGLVRQWTLFTLRHWRRTPWQTLLLLFILALGVATYLSIRLANRSAVESFGDFAVAVRGQVDGSIEPLAGNLPVQTLREVREKLGTKAVHVIPVLETTAVAQRDLEQVEGQFGRAPTLRLLGLDLLGIQNLNPRAPDGEHILSGPGEGEEEGDFRERLRGAPEVFISGPFARRLGKDPGDQISLLIRDQHHDLRIAGILPQQRAEVSAPENVLVMDISGLMRVLGQYEFLSRIDLVWQGAEHLTVEGQKRLAEVLSGEGVGWVYRPPEFRENETASMTAAFRLNLTILSLIALLTGVFLISQALDAVVVRRRLEIGILRSLGMTDGDLRKMWLGEILLLGLVGSALGVLLGGLLAQLTVGAVGQTINALYQGGGTYRVQWTGADLLSGFLLGVGASLVAGLIPLRDALRTPAAQVLMQGNNAPGLALLRRPWPGLLMVGVGYLLTFFPPLVLDGGARFPAGGYLTAFLWLIGGTFLIGTLFPPLGHWGRDLVTRWKPVLRPGVSRLHRATTRHRLAAAGLFIAVSMAGGMTLLVGSFEHTVERWLEHRFRADLYINPLGAQGAESDHLISSERWRTLAEKSAVVAADPFRSTRIQIEGTTTFLTGSDLTLLHEWQTPLWIERPLGEVSWLERTSAGWVPAIVNEAFAERFRVGVGDVLEFPTQKGLQSVVIKGVQADYGNEQGALLVDRTWLFQWLGDESLTNLTLFLREGEDPGILGENWAMKFPGLAFRSNKALRETAKGIFRQTFGITHALKFIALLVALLGLALTLVAIFREAVQELRILRNLGLTSREIASNAAIEGTGITFVGLAGGLLFSFGLGWLLIEVINKQSFGWTLLWAVPVWEMVMFSVGLLLAGILVSLGTGFVVVRKLLS
ncbi:MAG: FtsX-like permease family protein [Opitutales bacterium]|nr:FtsX-like permease family protein [Opitutales bacterium]